MHMGKVCLFCVAQPAKPVFVLIVSKSRWSFFTGYWLFDSDTFHLSRIWCPPHSRDQGPRAQSECYRKATAPWKELVNPRSSRGGEYSRLLFLFIVEPGTRTNRTSPPTPSCRLQVQLRRKRHARSNLSIIAPELIATLCTSARHLQK